MKRARRIVLSLLTALILLFSFSLSFADELDMLSAEILSKFKVVSTEIMTGTDIGFEESKTLTRAEVATIIIRLSGYLNGVADGIDTSDVAYADVPADHWAKDYIALATKLGLVKGIGDGKFAPDDLVTIQEVETMVCRAIGAGEYIDTLGEWPENYKQFSHEHGIDKYIIKMGGDDSLRINTAVIIANVLDLPKGHVTHGSDGSLGWQFDDKTVAEENLGVRLVENKNCTSVKAGSFNGITVKEGVDLSIVKEGTKYDYYINSKNVIVGIWPSSLKEDAEKEQDLINKGIDPSTLKDGQNKDTGKKRSGGGAPAGPQVISMYSITEAPSIHYDEVSTYDVFSIMKINGTTPNKTTQNVTSGHFTVVYSLTDATKYIFKGTDISLANLQARNSYSLITNTEGVRNFVQLSNATFDNAENPTTLTLEYLQMPNIIVNDDINSMTSLSAEDSNLTNFLNRGVRVKSVDTTNKIIVFETIGNGIYFNDTEEYYIDTLPLTSNVVVYAKVSSNRRELTVKWGQQVTNAICYFVEYTAKNKIKSVVFDNPNITADKSLEHVYTKLKDVYQVRYTPKAGYTFKGVTVTAEGITNSSSCQVQDSSHSSDYSVTRAIVEYEPETDSYIVSLTALGTQVNFTNAITVATLGADDILTMPVITVATPDKTDPIHEYTSGNEEYVVTYTPNPEANTFNGVTLTPEMLGANANGLITKTGASIDVKVTVEYDIKNDKYKVTYKSVSKVLDGSIYTPGALTFDTENKFTIPVIFNTKAYIGDTEVTEPLTVSGIGEQDVITVTYKANPFYVLKQGTTQGTTYLATKQNLVGGTQPTDDIISGASNNLDIKVTSVTVNESDNTIKVVFTPIKKKLTITNKVEANIAWNTDHVELTLPKFDHVKVYLTDSTQTDELYTESTYTFSGVGSEKAITIKLKADDFFDITSTDFCTITDLYVEEIDDKGTVDTADDTATDRINPDFNCNLDVKVSNFNIDATNEVITIKFTPAPKPISISDFGSASVSSTGLFKAPSIAHVGAPSVNGELQFVAATGCKYEGKGKSRTGYKQRLVLTYTPSDYYYFDKNMDFYDLEWEITNSMGWITNSNFANCAIYFMDFEVNADGQLLLYFDSYAKEITYWYIYNNYTSNRKLPTEKWTKENTSGTTSADKYKIFYPFTRRTGVIDLDSITEIGTDGKGYKVVFKAQGGSQFYNSTFTKTYIPGFACVSSTVSSSDQSHPNDTLTLVYKTPVDITTTSTATIANDNKFTPMVFKNASSLITTTGGETVDLTGKTDGTELTVKYTLGDNSPYTFRTTTQYANYDDTVIHNRVYNKEADLTNGTSEYDYYVYNSNADYYLAVTSLPGINYDYYSTESLTSEPKNYRVTESTLEVKYKVYKIKNLDATGITDASMDVSNKFTYPVIPNTETLSTKYKTITKDDEVVEITYTPVDFRYRFNSDSLTAINTYFETTAHSFYGNHGTYNMVFDSASVSNNKLTLKFRSSQYHIIRNVPTNYVTDADLTQQSTYADLFEAGIDTVTVDASTYSKDKKVKVEFTAKKTFNFDTNVDYRKIVKFTDKTYECKQTVVNGKLTLEIEDKTIY